MIRYPLFPFPGVVFGSSHKCGTTYLSRWWLGNKHGFNGLLHRHAEYYRKVTPPPPADAYSVLIVRDPYERARSCFAEKIGNRRSPMYQTDCFVEWMESLRSDMEHRARWNWHYIPQVGLMRHRRWDEVHDLRDIHRACVSVAERFNLTPPDDVRPNASHGKPAACEYTRQMAREIWSEDYAWLAACDTFGA